MTEVLNEISKRLKALNINYEYGRMTTSPPIYPYWVGEYSDTSVITEDGLETPTIILTGFSRGTYLELEKQKETIRNYFKYGISTVTENGTAIAIYYDGSINIPLDDMDLKKCQINLAIKLWKE